MDIENAKRHLSNLQEERRKHRIVLPFFLKYRGHIEEENNTIIGENVKEELKKHFPHSINKPLIKISSALDPTSNNVSNEIEQSFEQTRSTRFSIDASTYNQSGNSALNEMVNMIKNDKPMHLGILFSGSPAPGAHNIICGLLDSLKKKNRKNILYGFLNGYEGMKAYNIMELKNEYVSMFRNMGGLDMMSSSSSSLDITSEKEKKKCFKICRHLNLKGLIIVGGIDDNTKIAEFAEYFEHIHSLIIEKYEEKKKKKKQNNTDAIVKRENNTIDENLDLTNLTNKEKTNMNDTTNTIRSDQPSEKKIANLKYLGETDDDGSDELKAVSYEVVSDLSDEEMSKKIPKLKYGSSKKYCKTSIISIPKNVYGEFTNEHFESSFGFDTVVFSYCFYISFLMTHVQTYLTGYHFIKILGNVSSHIALECFLQTKPNMVLIGEEIKKKQWSISDIVHFLVDTIKIRYEKKKKKYGIVLIPEGLLKHVTEFTQLVKEIIQIKCAKWEGNKEENNSSLSISSLKKFIKDHLKKPLYELFDLWPDFFQKEILEEVFQKKDQFCYSHLSVERLLVYLTQEQLKSKHKITDLYFVSHFYGNECTCSLSTNFDSAYSYILGFSCPDIADKGYNGYICCIKNIKDILCDIDKTCIRGYPICSFVNVKEKKEGSNTKKKFYIKKKKVDLNGKYFEQYKKHRKNYLYTDRYRILSGIQYLDGSSKEHSFPLGSPSKIKSFPNGDLGNFHFNHDSICNRINFTVSEMKKDFLEVREEEEENKNYIKEHEDRGNEIAELHGIHNVNKENKVDGVNKLDDVIHEVDAVEGKEQKKEKSDIMCCNFVKVDETLSEVEKMLTKSVVKFNTILIRHNTSISFVNTSFESKINVNIFSKIQKIKEFYTVQENALTAGHIGRLKLGPSTKKVGVVLLSHSVPACNNIVVGLHQRLSMNNVKLIGFTRGIKGLLNNQFCLINDNNLKNFMNLGGFALLGVGLECDWKDIVTEVEMEMKMEVETQREVQIDNGNVGKVSKVSKVGTEVDVKRGKREEMVGEKKMTDEMKQEKERKHGEEEKNEKDGQQEEEKEKEEKKQEKVDEKQEKEEKKQEGEGRKEETMVKEHSLKKKNWLKKRKDVVTIYDLIEEEHIHRIIRSCRYHSIHNLVFIGDEKAISIMNILNDYFLNNNVDLKIITVPVSLYNSFDKNLIECSIGYHSMVRNISDIISNLQSECLNSGTYYYIVKIHTNISSSLILSIQLETHCNICLVGEGITNQMVSLQTIIENVSLIIIERINRKKYYGVILFSSNLIYFINDFFELSKDIDEHVKNTEDLNEIIESPDIPKKFESLLKKESIDLLQICTPSVKEKVLKKQKREDEEVESDIEVMLITEIRKYIKNFIEESKKSGNKNMNECYDYKKHMNNLASPINVKNIKIYKDINYLSCFKTIIKNIDREINCVMPTHFDNSLAYSHGLLAGLAVENDLINYVTAIRHLNLDRSHWSSSLYPGCFFVNNQNFKGPYKQV